MARQRFPRFVYGVGAEPDPRFTMANERTFLAWTRTSLALLAGGIALEVLGLGLHDGLRLAASLVLMATAVITAPLAYVGWARNERALRMGTPLPSSPFGLPVTVSVTVRNTGAVAGDEVVQLYIHQRSGSAARPQRELKGFQRVHLAPGEAQTLRFTLGRRELQFWSPVTRAWGVEPAGFDVWVGGSSAATAHAEFTLTR